MGHGLHSKKNVKISVPQDKVLVPSSHFSLSPILSLLPISPSQELGIPVFKTSELHETGSVFAIDCGKGNFAMRDQLTDAKQAIKNK